jgi:hypothetical protein
MNNLLKEHNIYIKFVPKVILTLGLTLVLVVFIIFILPFKLAIKFTKLRIVPQN